MDIEEALQASNPLGRTQFLIFTAAILMNTELGLSALSHVFLAEVPPHHCALNSKEILNKSIPWDGSKNAPCKEYVDPLLTNETQACSSGWIYDTSVTGKSIVSEWNLVCDKDFLPGLSQSVFLGGIGFGSVIFGPLADIYGRRPTVIGALILYNVIGLAVSLAPNFAVFVILRFLMGSVFKGVRIPLTTLMFEFLLPKHRPIMVVIPSTMTTAGYIILTGFGYFVRDWRYFHLLVITPCVILMTFCWCIPESIRWIISHDDMKRAETTMQKVAKFNKAVNFPNPAFSREHSIDAGDSTSPSSKSKNSENKSTMTSVTRKNQTGVRAIFGLFKQPVLTVTLIVSFNWLASTMIFFGFSLSTGTLAGDPYLNFFLISIVDFPAKMLFILIAKKIGNKIPIFFGFFGAGVTMIAIAILPYFVENGETLGTVLTSLAVLGKFSVSFGIPGIVMLSGELFPTTMRNSGMGTVQLIGNVGSLSAPILLYLDKFFDGLSFIIMGSCAFVTVAITVLLPETKGTVQPQTPADLQAMFDRKRRPRFGKGKQNLSEQITAEDGNAELTNFVQTTHT